MFWTMEKLKSFAVDNNITLDHALKVLQLVYMVSGVLWYRVFVDFLKSSMVKKFLKWLISHGSPASSRDDT